MIYTVGKLVTQPNDEDVLCYAGIKLHDELGYKDLGIRLFSGDYTEFDMSTKPERGDFMDHLEHNPSDVELVVALHLFGIQKIPGNSMDLSDGYFYNRRNGHMLRDTLNAGGMMIAWGDQPWLATVPFDKIDLRPGCNLFLYRRKI